MIPHPEELSFWGRIQVLLLIILIAVSFLMLTEYQEASGQSVPLPSSPYDARIVELDLIAADEAYKQQVEHLFQIWMRDDSGQPQRAIVGIQNAQRAYIIVREAIEVRAKELQERRKTP